MDPIRSPETLVRYIAPNANQISFREVAQIFEICDLANVAARTQSFGDGLPTYQVHGPADWLGGPRSSLALGCARRLSLPNLRARLFFPALQSLLP